MRCLWNSFWILIFISAPLCLYGQEADMPGTYRIRKAQKPPAVDGRMDKEEWGLAECAGPFTGPFNPDGTDLSPKKEFETKAYALWDPEHLYIAFVCMQPPPFYADKTGRDDKLFQQDVAEVYLDIGGDMMQYAEIQVSPLGTITDYYHVWTVKPNYPADKIDGGQASRHTGDLSWNLDAIKAASAPLTIEGRTVGWTVEMAIPVSPLLVRRNLPGKLAEGQNIRLNLLRYFYEPAAGGKRVLHHFNWSKTMKGRPHISPMAMRSAVCAP